jgi:hypothetical protein
LLVRYRLGRVRRKWKIPRVVLRAKNPSRASSAPRLESRSQNKPSSQGVGRHPRLSLHLTHSLHRVNSAFQLCIKQQQSLLRLVPLCFFLLGFPSAWRSVFFHNPCKSRFLSYVTPNLPLLRPKEQIVRPSPCRPASIAVSLYFQGPQNRRRDHGFERSPCQKGRLDLLATCFI